MKRSTTAGIMLMMIVEILIILPVGISEPLDSRNDILDHRVKTGRTDNFGGGDFILVELNSSMSFGIIHGNNEVDSPITIFSKGADIIGFHKEGRKDNPLKRHVFTSYTLNRLVEFNDTNGNGRLDPVPAMTDIAAADSIIKYVNLSRPWERSEPVKREGVKGISWEFSLFSRNATYSRFKSRETGPVEASASREVLDLIRFDFRITLTRERRIEVLYTYGTSDSRDDGNYQRLSRKEKELDGARVRLKMDHRILGWDFDHNNANPRLMLGFDLGFAVTYESRISAESDFLESEGTGVSIPSEGTRFSIWKEKDKRLSSLTKDELDGGDITLGTDIWSSRMFWDPALSRTPSLTARETRARLHLYRYSLIGPDSGIWDNTSFVSGKGVGVRISGGYTYPSLRMIVHDPGIETVGFRPPEMESREENGHGVIIDTIMENTTVTIFISILVIIIAVGIAALLTLSRRNLVYHDQELKKEQEMEIFHTGRKKKDWDSLRVK